MSLSRFFPQPVPVTLAGEGFLVEPFTLRDLARIEHWAASRIPSPLEGARPELEALEEWSLPWRRRVRDLLDAQEHWPPTPGDPACDSRLYDTEEGVTFLLTLALAKHHKDLTAALIQRVFAGLTVEELRSLNRVLWQPDPLEEVQRMIDGPPPQGDPPNWGKAICEVIEQTGWSYDRVGALTLPQWRNLRRRGQATGELPLGSADPSVQGAFARRVSFYTGLDDEPDAASTPGGE